MQKIKAQGIVRIQVGLVLDCEPLKGPNTTFWTVFNDNDTVGKVTSAVYSPRLKKNIALAMISKKFSEIGTVLNVKTSQSLVKARIVEKPFFDPKKKIASTKL